MPDSPPVVFETFQQRIRAQRPEMVLVLGSGLGRLVQRAEVIASVPYGEIPGLCTPTVHGHRGRLTLARWVGRTLLLCEGRLHHYEGHSWQRVTRLIELAVSCGVRTALLTNAAGGIHPDLSPGSLMVLNDHLDLTRAAWWRASQQPSPYSARLISLAQHQATLRGEPLLDGVYAMWTGPCYETPAEIRAARTWGADAVGMSTVREVNAASAAGLECMALSCITNRAAGLAAGTLSHEEVMTIANAAGDRLADLLEGIVAEV